MYEVHFNDVLVTVVDKIENLPLVRSISTPEWQISTARYDVGNVCNSL
jgi:hypothetical protein